MNLGRIAREVNRQFSAPLARPDDFWENMLSFFMQERLP